MVLSDLEARLSRDATNAHVRPEAGGSRVDLGRLFEAHAAAMYRTILAYTGGRGDLAEDAVGEAFSRAAARAAGLRDPVAWLYRVAFNVANDELRRERREGLVVRDSVQQPPDLSEVFEALKRLPPRERAVMALFYVLDLPVREVAARLGIAAATVRVHLTRGRRHLAALLGDEEATDR
jgi:RNA polymerase sigma-70 factor (ECF subfamily)